MNGTPTTRANPDIIDVFIILLIASAVDIFVFWMATQFISSPVFQNLPSFVTNAYSAVWTSVATGAAGIGLVITKYLASRGRPSINYFVYVVATTTGLFVIIIAIALVSSSIRPSAPPPPSMPFAAFALDIPRDGAQQIFDQESKSYYFSYKYKGKLSYGDGIFKGVLDPSVLETTAAFHPLPDQTLRRLAANTCYWKRNGSAYSVEWAPAHDNVNNSVDLGDILIKTSDKIGLPVLNFTLSKPEGTQAKDLWLCFRIEFNGGYIPIPQ